MMTYAEIHDLRVWYWMAGRMLYEVGSGDKEELGSEARDRRKWVSRQSELRTGGKVSIEHFFLLFLSSLLVSILHYFFGSWPGINGVGTGFTTSGSQSMGGGVSPCAGSAERSP
jgi:hypothetical protein